MMNQIVDKTSSQGLLAIWKTSSSSSSEFEFELESG